MPQSLFGKLFTLLSVFYLAWQAGVLEVGRSLPLAQSQSAEPVVQAVLFWMSDCPSCNEVVERILPAVQSQYDSRLEVRLVEVVTTEEVDWLYRVGSAYGLPKEEIGVPLLVIGGDVLVGADRIRVEFPSLINKYLAAGGVAFPNLDEITASTGFSAPGKAPLTQQVPLSSGFTLAAIVMVGMLAALIFTAWVMLRALQGNTPPASPAWVNLSIPILAVTGLGVAIYLTVIETTAIPAVCGPIGDCNTVQQSPYARLFGIIPVGLLGVFGYLAILAAWAWQRVRSGGLAVYAPLAVFGMGLFGTLFSVYLTYLELFVIKAVCMWCLSSAVIMTLLMLTSLPAAAQWLAVAEEEDE